MNQNHLPNLSPEAAGGGAAPRSASVSLRERGAVAPDAETMMDPANKALADALQMLLVLLQVVLLVIFLLYALSGFKQVKQGQTAIRLFCGAVVADRLEPGLRFAFPYPIGQLVRVDQGSNIQRLDTQFWQQLDERESQLPSNQIMVKWKLSPERDGSVLTADGNIAHTRWQIVYERRDATKWARNVHQEHENAIVSAAVQRGVVQAVAKVGIDDLLRQGREDFGGVVLRAQTIAQQALDTAQTGIQITQLTLTEKMPPTATRERFEKVQSAEQKAGSKRSEAEGERNKILSAAAGRAATAMLAAIDEYEAALARNDHAARDKAQETINAILDGSVSDETFQLAGDAARVMDEARRYRTEAVSKRQTQVAMFEAKLTQYKADPFLLVQREWQSAQVALRAKPFVESLLTPTTGSLTVLNLSRDLIRLKEMEARREETRGAEQRRKREEDIRRQQFETIKGLPATSG